MTDCPRDVQPRAFRKLMAEKPPAMSLVRSHRRGHMRVFTFRADWDYGGHRRGDLLEIPVACKFKRRRA